MNLPTFSVKWIYLLSFLLTFEIARITEKRSNFHFIRNKITLKAGGRIKATETELRKGILQKQSITITCR